MRARPTARSGPSRSRPRSTPGGGYDLFARPVASHLGQYVPGKPTVVVRYMPGAGGILAANHLFNIAPKDGTVLGIIPPTAPLDSKLAPSTVKFTAGRAVTISAERITSN